MVAGGAVAGGVVVVRVAGVRVLGVRALGVLVAGRDVVGGAGLDELDRGAATAPEPGMTAVVSSPINPPTANTPIVVR